MKKLLLLLCAIVLSIGGAGAQPITVKFMDGTNEPYNTYCTRNSDNNMLTSNDASGLAGVTFSAPVIDRYSTWWDVYCLALKTSSAQTDEDFSITAPTGYIIVGYSLTVRAVSSSYQYKVVLNGTTQTVSGASEYTFSSSNVFAPSISGTLQCTASTVGNWLGVTSFTVTLAKIVTNTSDISTTKSYFVRCNRSTWVVANGATTLSTIDQEGLAASLTDAKQQFAFVTPNNTDYYLYSVSAKKFLYAVGKAYGASTSGDGN